MWSSAGSSASQWACFLATNDHFSSSWTSRVPGGNGHELVVGVVGLLAGQARQPRDGVAVDPGEPLGLADAVALGEVLEDRQRELRGQPGAEERGALALGEPSLTGRTVEEADVLTLAAAIADGEVTAPRMP